MLQHAASGHQLKHQAIPLFFQWHRRGLNAGISAKPVHNPFYNATGQAWNEGSAR